MTDSLADTQRTRDKEPQGIGGWLLLPIIHLIADMVILVWATIKGWHSARQGDHAASGGRMPPTESLLFIFFYLFCVFVCAYAIYVLVRFFQKKRTVPELMMFFYLLIVVKMLSNLALLKHYPDARDASGSLYDGIKSLVQSVIAAIIWISYFRKSVRVRNTFVN